MIATVTLNSALDRVIFLRQFRMGRRIVAENALTTVGGKGTVVASLLQQMGRDTKAYGFMAGPNGHVMCALMDKAGQLRFRNKRAEMYWRLRDALDPTNPDPIALPPDQELLGDLTAPRYQVVTMGRSAAIQILSKDDIRLLLGRSPDKGDSVAMTFAADIPQPEPKPRPKSWRDRFAASDSEHWDQATA